MSKQRDAMKILMHQIFHKKPAELYVLIWTMPDKKSHWLQYEDEVYDLITDEMIASHDVYFGPGYSPEDYGPNKRCPQDNIAGIVGCWADVDFGSGHAKTVCPDPETAAVLLKEAGPSPTVIVGSGNGWHCYWMFEEPMIFATEKNQAYAKTVIADWIKHLQKTFKTRGYALDSVQDLSRVLRVPGTLNHKGSGE